MSQVYLLNTISWIYILEFVFYDIICVILSYVLSAVYKFTNIVYKFLYYV